MAELKTKKNEASVDAFLNAIKDERKKQDAKTVSALMERVTGFPPKMWGTSIVGFGEFTYRYASGRTGNWMMTGFSPRAQGLTIYLMAGFGNLQPLLSKLGKHSTSVSCLNIKRLEDVDTSVLEKIVLQGIDEVKALAAKKPAEVRPSKTKKVAASRPKKKKAAKKPTTKAAAKKKRA